MEPTSNPHTPAWTRNSTQTHLPPKRSTNPSSPHLAPWAATAAVEDCDAVRPQEILQGTEYTPHAPHDFNGSNGLLNFSNGLIFLSSIGDNVNYCARVSVEYMTGKVCFPFQQQSWQSLSTTNYSSEDVLVDNVRHPLPPHRSTLISVFLRRANPSPSNALATLLFPLMPTRQGCLPNSDISNPDINSNFTPSFFSFLSLSYSLCILTV